MRGDHSTAVTTLKLRLSESRNYRFIYVNSSSNTVHVFVPISSGVRINLDNTCKAALAMQQFFGKDRIREQGGVSALDELQDYEQKLNNDLALLASYNLPNTQAIRERLGQVQAYLQVIRSIRQTGTFQCLESGLPEYPQPVRELLGRSDRNLRAMLLRPVNPDGFIRSVSPLFSMDRVANGALYQGLATIDLGRVQAFTRPNTMNSNTLAPQILQQLGRLNYAAPVGEIVEPLRQALRSSGFFDERSITDDSIRSKLGVFYTLDEPFTDQLTEGGTPENDMRDTIAAIIEQSSPNFNSSAASTVTAFNSLVSAQSIDLRRRLLLIITQFFLAQVNLWAHAKQPSVKNFGQLLERDRSKSNELVRLIQSAYQDGRQVERAIVDFINRNRVFFGLSHVFAEPEIAEILDRFEADYATVKEAPHFDEFMLLDMTPKRQALFHAYQGHIAFNLLRFKETASLRHEFNSSSFTKALREIDAIPAELNLTDRSPNRTIDLPFEQVRTAIERAIPSTGDERLLQQLLLQHEDGRFVFEILGEPFFSEHASSRDARARLERLHRTIRNSDVSRRFNDVVLSGSAQILLTPAMARALYVAVQDRKELPGRVLQYQTVEHIRALINDLQTEAQSNTRCRELRDIQNVKVRDNLDGNFVIEASEPAITRINTLLRGYSQSMHLAMVMASSLYKQVADTYGESSREYQAMQRLSNNLPGDPTPHKLLRALELLGIPLNATNRIRYNNTLNDLPYLSDANRNNPSIAKKGGSGFIIDNVDGRTIQLIENITNYQSTRFTVLPEYQLVLNHVIREFNNPQATQWLAQFHYGEREWIMMALQLLGIPYEDRLSEHGTLIFKMEQTAQAKIKWLANQHGTLPASIPFNSEERLLTANYRPALNLQALQNLDSSPPVPPAELRLTLASARAIYVAVQDRRQLPVERVLQFSSQQAIQSLLNDLATLDEGGNTYSQGYRCFRACVVRQNGQGLISIQGPPRTLELLEQVIDRYRQSVHLAMVMSGALYKEVEERFGTNSEEYREMQQLNNNTPDDPTPYKLWRAMTLLNLDVAFQAAAPGTSPVRYNNTLNALPFTTAQNMQDRSIVKKGGSGFVIDGLTDEFIQQIETITQHQANRLRMTTFHEYALYQTIEQLNRSAGALLDRIIDQREKCETALLLLGIDYKEVSVDVREGVCTVALTPVEQAKILKLLKRMADLSGVVDIGRDIALFNNEVEQLTRNYVPSLMANWSEERVRELLEQRRQQAERVVFPDVLPYRQFWSAPVPEGDNLAPRLEAPAAVRIGNRPAAPVPEGDNFAPRFPASASVVTAPPVPVSIGNRPAAPVPEGDEPRRSRVIPPGRLAVYRQQLQQFEDLYNTPGCGIRWFFRNRNRSYQLDFIHRAIVSASFNEADYKFVLLVVLYDIQRTQSHWTARGSQLRQFVVDQLQHLNVGFEQDAHTRLHRLNNDNVAQVLFPIGGRLTSIRWQYENTSSSLWFVNAKNALTRYLQTTNAGDSQSLKLW